MRSLKHLLALADELCERGVGLVILKQHIDTTTPAGRLVFHILGAIDEFQRGLIVEAPARPSAPPGPAAVPGAERPAAAPRPRTTRGSSSPGERSKGYALALR